MIKNKLANIRFYFVTAAIASAVFLFFSCSPYKKVYEGEYMVKKNTLRLNGKKTKIPESRLVKQQPNEKFLSLLPIKLNLYSLSAENPDSTFRAFMDKNRAAGKTLAFLFSEKGMQRLDSTFVGINDFFVKSGEPPVIYSEGKSLATTGELKSYYFNKGYFDVEAGFSASLKDQDARVTYNVETGKPYYVDSLEVGIGSPVIEKLYGQTRGKSKIKTGSLYDTGNFMDEAARLTDYFRQNGVYNFTENSIRFKIDTNGRANSAKVLMEIHENNSPDNPANVYGNFTEPFKQYKIKDIEVLSDFSFDRTSVETRDSTEHKGIMIYSQEQKTAYRPRLITDAIIMKEGGLFRLSDYNDTYAALRSLRLFQTINVSLDETDTTLTNDSTSYLDIKIYLSPIKKYTATLNFEVSRSSLLGLGTTGNLSFSKNNIFRGGELWTNSIRLTLGSYYSPDGVAKGFLNAYEINLSSMITFPKFILPFNTEGLVPKRYTPKTNLSLGFGLQKNIGLDRINLNAAIDYQWDESRHKQHSLTLFKFSFLTNTNRNNYFRVFGSRLRDEALMAFSQYDRQWSFPEDKGDGQYIISMENAAFNDAGFKASQPTQHRTIADDIYQYERYTSDYLIPAIGYTFTFSNQRYDKTRDYHYLQLDFWAAGNLTYGMAKLFNYSQINTVGGINSYTMFGVPFAQYVKFTVNYSRYHNFGENNTIAYRFYGGLTFPYGNTPNNVPFSETFFGGGVNYERGWLSYELGPGGSADKSFTYNIGNLKLTASAEYRFRMYQSLYGAFFVDAGNIWYTRREMALNDAAVFDWNRFYKEISVSSGVGIRYDFSFFVARLDVGFKVVDPSMPEGRRWALNKNNFTAPRFQFALAYPF